MTTVIRPVSVQYTDFRHGRIALLIIAEIVPDMLKILECHGKGKGIIQLFKRRFLHLHKTFQYRHIRGFLKFRNQRIRLHAARFPGVHGVYAVRFDFPEILLRNVPQNQIGNGSPDHRLLVLFQKTDTLHRRIRSLVKLPRQIFHGEYPGMFRNLDFLIIQLVHRRLREYGTAGPPKNFFRNIFHVITDKYSYSFRMYAEKTSNLLVQLLCLYRKGFLFFHIDTLNDSHTPSILY